MKSLRHFLILAVVLAGLAGLVAASVVVVDEIEYGVVTSFGRVAAVYGDEPGEAGPHWKAPWESAIRIDRRFRVFDPMPREVMTGDKRNLEVAPYVVWRVSDPVVFLRGSGSHELAEARLDERISAEPRATRSDAGNWRAWPRRIRGRWSLDALTREVLEAVVPAAREELGVEVVDVRLRRFAHPLEVRPAVFDLIRSERRQVAAKLRAEGEAQYLTITSQADRARDTILAEAEARGRRGSEARPRPRRPAPSTTPTPATPGSSSSSARSNPIARSSTTAPRWCSRRRARS